MADKPTLAQRLAAQASDAAELRNVATNPDVVALDVEKVRAQVDRMAWSAILLGLGFTMVNVQVFGAGGAAVWSLPWLAAWLLDPIPSLLLLAVVRAEQITARWQVVSDWQVTATKWGCFAATYTMNTWASWTAGVPSGVVLHSVPPVMILLGAEVAPVLRDALTRAVLAAANARAEAEETVAPAGVPAVPAARTAYPATGPVFPALFPSSPARPPFDPPTVEFPPLTMLPGWPLPEPVPAPEPAPVHESGPAEAREKEHRYAALVAAVKAWLADPEKPRPTVRAVKAEHRVGTDIARRALDEARA